MNNGWPNIAINEICSLVKGSYPTLKTEPGPYPLIVTAAYRRTASTYQLDQPSVCIPLVSSTGHGDAALHRVHYAEGKYAVANLLVALIPKDMNRCYAKYLYYLLNTKKDQLLVSLMQGTANVSLKVEDIANVQITLPPLAEQRRIVAKIDALAAKIAEARGLRAKSLAETLALSTSASSEIFKSRDGWSVAKVSEFSEKPQYGFTASASRERIGPRMLRITDIQDGRVNWQDVPYCQCAQPGPYLLRAGDLVFARTGATTGKSFLIHEVPEPAVFASYLIRLRVRERATPEYLYAFFQSPRYWDQVIDQTTGTGQPNCNGKKLAAMDVPIAPAREQRRIVAYLDDLQAKVDRLKVLQAESAAELDALLPSILDQAFKGEL